MNQVFRFRYHRFVELRTNIPHKQRPPTPRQIPPAWSYCLLIGALLFTITLSALHHFAVASPSRELLAVILVTSLTATRELLTWVRDEVTPGNSTFWVVGGATLTMLVISLTGSI